MPKTSRTARKGFIEFGIAVVVAALTWVIDEGAGLGLSSEHFLIVQGLAQVGLQAVRRYARDTFQGQPG